MRSSYNFLELVRIDNVLKLIMRKVYIINRCIYIYVYIYIHIYSIYKVRNQETFA